MYDDEKQDWVPKWGYNGKNKEIESQWIVEVPKDKGQSPTALYSLLPALRRRTELMS